MYIYSGIVCTLVSTFVPFEFLNDLISAGVIVAFNFTNSAVIIVHRESPITRSTRLRYSVVLFNVLALAMAFCIQYIPWDSPLVAITVCVIVALVCTLAYICRAFPDQTSNDVCISSSTL